MSRRVRSSTEETETMSVQERSTEVEHRDWGDGEIVIADTDKTGAWVKYDPEDPMFDLSNWR